MDLKLNNGARIIDHIEFETRSGDAGDFLGIVLAQSSNDYVTWRYNRDADKKANCYWGHYFRTLKDATSDYATRVNEFTRRYPCYKKVS